MSNKLSAKVAKFDKENFQLTLDLSFVDEDLIEYLEELETTEEAYVWTIENKYSKKNEIHDGQRKRWFHQISKILKFFKIPLRAEAIQSFSVDFKFHYLPVTYIQIGDRSVPIIPSLKRGTNNPVTPEKMQEAILQIQQTYEGIGVKF